jgi:hypothetical protein
MWAFPSSLVKLHMGSIDYYDKYLLHYVLYIIKNIVFTAVDMTRDTVFTAVYVIRDTAFTAVFIIANITREGYSFYSSICDQGYSVEVSAGANNGAPKRVVPVCRLSMLPSSISDRLLTYITIQ